MSFASRSVARAACLLLPLVALPSQQPIKAAPPKPPSFTLQHVIEAADLQASPGGATEGQPVTFRFKMKNTGTTMAPQVPWVLEVDGKPVGNGTQPNLAPGDSKESTKVWTATPGTHTVRFVIDPAGTGSASGAPAALRSRQLAYSVTPLPATEVRLIDWDAAKAVGMNYANGLWMPTTCQGVLQPISSAGYVSVVSGPLPQYVGWVHVYIQCPFVTGGRMSSVVYDNLVLRNGWRVKDVQVKRLYQSGTSDWQFNGAPPAPGSDRPRTAIGLWANAAAVVELAFKVDIEGPRGTNPYR